MVNDGAGLAVDRTDVIVMEAVASVADDMDELELVGLWSSRQPYKNGEIS